MADPRDAQTWVTLELTPLGQTRVEEGSLEDDILDALDAPFHWPVFVPSRTYRRGNKVKTVHLVEGYAFVGTGMDEQRYFALERSPTKLVKKVMSTDTVGGMRVLHTLKDDVIEKWRCSLRDEITSDITEGMLVSITEGMFSNLEGQVLDVDGEHADVLINLRSAQGIARLPKYYLDPADTQP